MAELKILICDDDPDLLGLLVRRLDKMGLEPDLANDGREALALIEQNNYDVIVTDIYMPEATGLEVLQHAKQLDQDTQVMIITSSATLDNAIDALNHGAFGYLTKPFDHLIVFDNMVSRALEHRHLLVAEKHKAEAQRRRGDMLEDEVAQRVQQLQRKQKGLIDLLGSLPDGILVVEKGGKVVLSSPVGERWLARDEQTADRPIHSFIAQVHAEMAEPSKQVRLNDRELQLMAADFPNDGDAKRKAVIIRELEESGVGAGSLVTDTVLGIKKGLARLYEQGLGTETVLELASQFAVLEQLSGWKVSTGDLKPAGKPAPAQPATEPPATQQPATQQPAPRSAEPSPPAPESAVDQDPQPTTVNTTPPFLQPRERINTADLGEPRMNTTQLQEALLAVDEASEGAAPEAPPPAPAPARQQMADTQPAQQPPQPSAGGEAPAPATEAEAPVGASQPQQQQPAEPDHAPEAAEPATPLQAEEAEVGPSATEAEFQAAAEALTAEPKPPVPAQSKMAAAAQRRAVSNGTGELGHAAAESEADFPAGRSTGELDSAIFHPRVIPEEMNAKLETPTDLPNPNGKRGLLNRAKGPLKIQSPQADTQIFRRVLAGLSGSDVEGVTGEIEGPPQAKPGRSAKSGQPGAQPAQQKSPPSPQATPEAAPEAESVAEREPEAEPQPTPIKAEGGRWPPKRPSEDPEWDDSLDTSE